MREYRLERTGDTLVRFSGELIAEGSSEQDSGLHSHSWHEIEIYETQDGKWIGHICFISGKTARDDEYTAMVADSQDELRQQLLKYKHVRLELVQARTLCRLRGCLKSLIQGRSGLA